MTRSTHLGLALLSGALLFSSALALDLREHGFITDTEAALAQASANDQLILLDFQTEW